MMQRRWLVVGIALALAVVGFIGFRILRGHAAVPGVRVPIEPRSAMAGWPWTGVKTEVLSPGVTLHGARDSANGTRLSLLEFDTAANPKLCFELYDADEDDKKPLNNRVKDGESRSAWWAFEHLKSRGRMVAVWNGP